MLEYFLCAFVVMYPFGSSASVSPTATNRVDDPSSPCCESRQNDKFGWYPTRIVHDNLDSSSDDGTVEGMPSSVSVGEWQIMMRDGKAGVEESRGKNSKKEQKYREKKRRERLKRKMTEKMAKLLLTIGIIVKAKLAAIATIMGNAIATIAIKAILVSKIALILGTLIFLKKFIANPSPEVKSHVVVKKKLTTVEESKPKPEAHKMAYKKQLSRKIFVS